MWPWPLGLCLPDFWGGLSRQGAGRVWEREHCVPPRPWVCRPGWRGPRSKLTPPLQCPPTSRACPWWPPTSCCTCWRPSPPPGSSSLLPRTTTWSSSSWKSSTTSSSTSLTVRCRPKPLAWPWGPGEPGWAVGEDSFPSEADTAL